MHAYSFIIHEIIHSSTPHNRLTQKIGGKNWERGLLLHIFDTLSDWKERYYFYLALGVLER
jgi:hypothetical protein